jgi:CO/xanthine dehydrogenase FAD-binding subunit
MAVGSHIGAGDLAPVLAALAAVVETTSDLGRPQPFLAWYAGPRSGVVVRVVVPRQDEVHADGLGSPQPLTLNP